MNSRPKLTGISKFKNNITSKLRRNFNSGLPSGVRYYTNQQGHLEYKKEVSQETIDKLNEIQTELDNLIKSIDKNKYEIREITNLKENYELYSVIMNDPTRDFANRKQSLIELLSNIDWETIIRFFKTNKSKLEYKNTIKLIYQFLMQLQTGEIICRVSANHVEIELANKLIGISQRIQKEYIQTATGKIKKSRKPKKPRKHTLVKKERKKKSTIKN